MVIDLFRCVGCNACTLACKVENGTPQEVAYAQVLESTVGKYPAVSKVYTPVLCNHCDDAPCVSVCPTGASYTRPDGIVMVDKDLCMGCQACVVACPYEQRFFLEKGALETGYHGDDLTPYEKKKDAAYDEGSVNKCTFCSERVDKGLDPACVVTCPTRARIFGDLDDPNSEVSQLIRHGSTVLLPEAGTNPCVHYIKGQGG